MYAEVIDEAIPPAAKPTPNVEIVRSKDLSRSFSPSSL
jgi:hypothetical protein